MAANAWFDPSPVGHAVGFPLLFYLFILLFVLFVFLACDPLQKKKKKKKSEAVWRGPHASFGTAHQLIYIYFASGRREAIAATWALCFPPNTNSRGSVIPGPATTATPCGADQLDFEEEPWPESRETAVGLARGRFGPDFVVATNGQTLRLYCCLILTSSCERHPTHSRGDEKQTRVDAERQLDCL